jgi:hypothetical protein
MLVREARDVARQWVIDEAANLPGFVGAFHTGSTIWLPDESVLPATSDVDVMLVLDDPDPPQKPGKIAYQGVILDVSYLAAGGVRSAEQVLRHYHLAGSFRCPNVIVDPSGNLTAMQTVVSHQFARRHWVRQRCEHAASTVHRHLDGLRSADALHGQVMAWLFGTGVTTHLLLVAGLRNPTIRTRYLAARDLLAEYGQISFYLELLALLGCAEMTRQQATQHLTALADAFDAASAVIRSPFIFASDLSAQARPIAIDGSRDLIERGDQREAIFWIVATYARCMAVFHQDAPALTERYETGLWHLLADLGIDSPADLRRRDERVRAFLPSVWAVADAIVAANPEIQA